MELYDYMDNPRPAAISWPWQVTQALRALGYPISDPVES
jgi:hypothetical protein